MAGDWIKMRMDLPDDPAVVSIALALGITEDEVVGKLHRLWCWADRHAKDGFAGGITAAWLDKYIQRAGFSEAVQKAGWLAISPEGIRFPDFDRHNGKSAKQRAEATERQRVSRKCHTKTVTKTRPEKRREEKREEPPVASATVPPPADAGGASEHAAAAFDAWWKSYPVRGNPGKRGDRKAAWREWLRMKPAERDKVPIATARLVASGQMPKDAERFLRPARGGGLPEYQTWLEDTSDAVVAALGAKQTHAEEKESLNVPYDASWMLKANHAG